MSLGLCLSGGGVKGAAHIGAIKALEEENIKPDFISGTSSGSIVATLYAVGYSAEEIKKIFTENATKIKYFDLKNIKNIIINLIKKKKFSIEGLNTGEIIEKIINKYCNKKGIKNINEIKENLLIASVSINTGNVYFFQSKYNNVRYSDEFIYINNINIGKAVRASCSYPGIFCPYQMNNDLLIDGGVRENIPWKQVKNMGIDKVLCITFEEKEKEKKDKNIIDIISRSLNLIGRELNNYELIGADYLLKINTKNVSLLDYSKINYLYNEGYYQMKKYLNKIKIK